MLTDQAKASEANHPHATLQRTRVGDIMTRRVLTIRFDDPATLASQMMLWASVRHLVVTDDVTVVGVVSDRDLLRVASPNDPSLNVADVMTAEPITTSEDANLEEAAARMAARRIDCLPVLRGDRLVGILTTSDVLAERGRLLHKNRAARGRIPTVGSIMRTEIAFVTRDRTLLDAVEKLLLADIRHLPVVDEDKRVVGMLSDRDVRSAVGDPHDALYRRDRRDLEETRVEQLMTHNPITVEGGASVLELADALIDERVGAVPVVDGDQRLIGVVSYLDVLAFVFGRPAP